MEYSEVIYQNIIQQEKSDTEMIDLIDRAITKYCLWNIPEVYTKINEQRQKYRNKIYERIKTQIEIIGIDTVLKENENELKKVTESIQHNVQPANRKDQMHIPLKCKFERKTLFYQRNKTVPVMEQFPDFAVCIPPMFQNHPVEEDIAKKIYKELGLYNCKHWKNVQKEIDIVNVLNIKCDRDSERIYGYNNNRFKRNDFLY